MLIKRSEQTYCRKIKNQWVILDKDKKHIRVLNETGGFIWELLKKPLPKEQIIKKTAKNYNVESSTVAKDLDDFIHSYVKQGFLIVVE